MGFESAVSHFCSSREELKKCNERIESLECEQKSVDQQLVKSGEQQNMWVRQRTIRQSGSETATSWSPVRPKIRRWRLNFLLWSPMGDHASSKRVSACFSHSFWSGFRMIVEEPKPRTLRKPIRQRDARSRETQYFVFTRINSPMKSRVSRKQVFAHHDYKAFFK